MALLVFPCSAAGKTKGCCKGSSSRANPLGMALLVFPCSAAGKTKGCCKGSSSRANPLGMALLPKAAALGFHVFPAPAAGKPKATQQQQENENRKQSAANKETMKQPEGKTTRYKKWIKRIKKLLKIENTDFIFISRVWKALLFSLPFFYGFFS
jgi:hypothetical protein